MFGRATITLGIGPHSSFVMSCDCQLIIKENDDDDDDDVTSLNFGLNRKVPRLFVSRRKSQELVTQQAVA